MLKAIYRPCGEVESKNKSLLLRREEAVAAKGGTTAEEKLNNRAREKEKIEIGWEIALRSQSDKKLP